MLAQTRWIVYSLIGILGAIATFLISLPWIPKVTFADLFGPQASDPHKLDAYFHRIQNAGSITTLPYLYGHIAYFLLGALIATPLVVAIRWEREGWKSGLFWGALCFPVAGAISRAADALSDSIDIAMKGGTGGLEVGLWCVLMAAAITSTVLLFEGPTSGRAMRALIAGCVAAVACYFVRQTANTGSGLTMIGDMLHDGSMNNIRLFQPAEFFLEYIALGACIGFGFGFAEAQLRRPVLKLLIGRNEIQEWELPNRELQIGSLETLPIALPRNCNVAPKHAILRPLVGDYAISVAEGRSLSVNGRSVNTAYLRDGDKIQIGDCHLVFTSAQRAFDYKSPNGNNPALHPTSASAMGSSTAAVDLQTARAAIIHQLESIDGRRTDLPIGETILGRDLGAGYRLSAQGTSRHHARILVDGPSGTATVSDLGSTNGIKVNGAPVAQHPLQPGDRIDLGGERLIYHRR